MTVAPTIGLARPLPCTSWIGVFGSVQLNDCAVANDHVKFAAIASGGSCVSWSVTFAATMVTLQLSPEAKSAEGSSVNVLGPPLTVAVRGPLAHAMPYQLGDTFTGSEKVTVMFEPTPTPVAPAAGTVVVTDGAISPPPCAPSPSNVSIANPSHSIDGSKTSVPFASPLVTESLRRSVLSAVLTRPVPHSVPGLKPICPITSMICAPLRSTTASLPLNHPAPLVWSACARIAAFADDCASTKTSFGAIVPTRLIVRPALTLPLKNIWTL